jgi:translation initiation factor IF-3
VIGDDGKQIGVMRTEDALRMAQERDLDLVEVAAEARPPVCRILDYSKYKYEQAQKLKQARKHQQQITVREIKFRPKIAEHDYATKKGHVERFLRHKDKVKITIMFRGREVTHPERGVMILDRLADELSTLAIVEQRPTQDGRNMTMMLGPSKAVLAGTLEEEAEAAEAEAAARENAMAERDAAEAQADARESAAAAAVVTDGEDAAATAAGDAAQAPPAEADEPEPAAADGSPADEPAADEPEREPAAVEAPSTAANPSR